MASELPAAQQVRIFARALLQNLERLEPLVASRADPEEVYSQVAAAIDACLQQLRSLHLLGRDNQVPASELWNVAGHVLARGWLQNRARAKPRGYAGDYELLARMYRGELCDEPLGRLFDRYFQEQPAPVAVRNRMTMMADWIVEESRRRAARADGSMLLRVAIVGSAFGLEVRNALLRIDPPLREQVHVTLLDLDPDAIDFARRQLAMLLPPERLTMASGSLFRLPQRPALAAILRDSDLLFCPGLFDYLDDAAAAIMLRCLYDLLAPGGRLTVFQFAPHDPTRAYMEWFANWRLTYRNDPAFRRMVESAELDRSTPAFAAEPQGVDLYVTLTRQLQQ